MSKFKVVVTDDRYGVYDEEIEVLKSIDAEIVVKNCSTVTEVIEQCADADGIMVNLAPMPAEAIKALKKCKVISRYGVGYDNVDVEACTKEGIYVANVPDYCFEEVSDHALALLMSCARKTARRDAQVRKGMWNIGKADPIYRIKGKCFAFLGFGAIAKCLLRKIKGLEFSRVLVYDPFVSSKIIASMGAEKTDFNTAISEADYISIHMPLNKETKGIINLEAFSRMKPTAILINTSRGPVIEEKDLIYALENKLIHYAGLDVHEKEPIKTDNELFNMQNCVLTDHVGWYSEESMRELKRKVAENVRDVLIGDKPKYPVNRL